MKITMRYFEKNRTLNLPAGGLSTAYTYSANGIFDPNITGVGHQSAGFDQMNVIYDHYTVIGAKIRVDFTNLDTSNPVLVGIKANDVPTIGPDPEIVIESGNVVWKNLSVFGSGSGSKCTLTSQINISKFLGRPNIMSEDDLRGTSTTNPAEGCYFAVFGADIGGDDPGNIEFCVQVDYIVVWTEPKILPKS